MFGVVLRQRVFALFATLAVTGLLVPTAVNAQALEDMHTQVAVKGGRICMADHGHYGSGVSDRSRKYALRAAIQNWSGFTSLEYGDHWGRYSRAIRKIVECERTSSGWSCGVTANPCRAGRVARRRGKRRGIRK